MSRFPGSVVGAAIALAGCFHSTAAQENQSGIDVSASLPSSEWPAYRRDSGLTGFSPLSGGLAKQPVLRWSYDLGGANASTEQAQLVDVNGDGRKELLRVLPDRLICQTVEGKRLWETEPLAHPQVVQIRDFAGDGTRGLLVASSTGVAHHRHLVSGTTGESVLLYTCGNVFGRYERIGHLLEDVPGEQLCAWWSGDSDQKFGADAARGVGYLWSFENGVETPTVRLQVEETGTIYAPLHLFADMNGDGTRDMVMISHEAMWVYDLETGERITHSVWGPQIRTYWAATGAVPLAPGQLPSLLMINPMIPGVQVVTQDGTTARSKWKVVVGDREDQYQTKVKITRAAPDPFVDLDADGNIEILAAVTNEHGDDRTHLVVFDANHGDRLYDAADQTVLTVDELDGVTPPEILIREGESTLRVCHWNGRDFMDLFQADHVTPMLIPAPAEGHLARAVGARSSSRNIPVYRAPDDSNAFLLEFSDGIYACRLTTESLQQLHRIAKHPDSEPVAPSSYSWDGKTLTVDRTSDHQVTYEVPFQQSYTAPPPLIGRLDGEQRIVVREHAGSLVSLATDGSDRQVLVEQSPSSLGITITDLNGDGQNEVLAPFASSNGTVGIVAVDQTANRLFQIDSPENATSTVLGPTGRLGAGRGRWFVVRYQIPYQNTRVVAYDGTSGEELWERDYLGPERVPATKFMLHLPTAVHDVDGDGADDLIASSENWYGVISVKDNRLLTPVTTITAGVPGHWGAYATPVVARLLQGRPPLVFHNNAYALTVVSNLQGDPIWHYGLTRDTTHASLSGLADLDGDATLELITTQKDGFLQAFDAAPVNELCPSCPPGQQLTAASHSGHIRWTSQLPPPLSDFASLDIDGDGRTELLCGSGDGKLYALQETDGVCEVVWSSQLGAPVGAPVVADLDSDGTAEILVNTAIGQLCCLEAASP